MARYYVHIHGLQLLVVLSSSALVSALRDKIKQRLPSLQSSDTDIADGDVVLHLHSGDGPILDVEDVLSDAVQDPTTEEIHAVICVDGKTEIPKVSCDLSLVRCPSNVFPRYRLAPAASLQNI